MRAMPVTGMARFSILWFHNEKAGLVRVTRRIPERQYSGCVKGWV